MKNVEIVTLSNGEAVTTTLAIAEGTEIDHASVIKLVRTYLADLEEFGRVGFEIAPFETAGGVQQQPNKFIAWLLSTAKWIHKRPGTKTNLPYSHIRDAGYLTVKEVTVTLPDGSDRIQAQTMVTGKGIAKLALILGVNPKDGLAA